MADEVVQVVRVMDGLNRYRFMSDTESLAAWESASNVLSPSRARKGAEPPAGGEVPAGRVRGARPGVTLSNRVRW